MRIAVVKRKKKGKVFTSLIYDPMSGTSSRIGIDISSISVFTISSAV